MKVSKKGLLRAGGILLAIGLLPFAMPYVAILMLCAIYGGMFAAISIAHGTSGFVLLVILFYGRERGSKRWLLPWIIVAPLIGAIVAASRYVAVAATHPSFLAWADIGWTLLLAPLVLLCMREFLHRWGAVLLALDLATTSILTNASIVTAAWNPAAGLMPGIVVPVATYVFGMAIFALAALACARMAADVVRHLKETWPGLMPRALGIVVVAAALGLQMLAVVRS